MANQERGEFRLVSPERSYILRLTTNSCCELEDFSGRLFDTILLGAQQGSLRDVRLILWAALREHCPEIATDDKESLKAVGSIIDACGGVLGIRARIRAFIKFNADSGQPSTTGGASKDARPLSAQGGTGVGSMSTH